VDQGLFAAMAVEIKQGENLKKLLDDIVSPLLLGEVYDFKILALRPIREIDDKEIGRDIISTMTNKVDRSNIFFFDVEMNVKDDYKKSIINVFESTAKKKISLGAITQISDYFDQIPEMRGEQAKLQDKDLGNSVIYFVHNKKMDAYIFDVSNKKFFSDFKWIDFFGQWRNAGLRIPYGYEKPVPKLQVKLLNENDDEIVAHRLAYPYTGMPRNNNDFGIVLKPRFEQSDGSRNSNCRYPCEQPLIGSQLYYPPQNSRHVIDLDVRKIRVFLAIGDKERASKKIVVEFVQ
jgi:hypothetical protein